MMGAIKKPRGYPASATLRAASMRSAAGRGVMLIFSDYMGSVDAEAEPCMPVMPGVQKAVHLGKFGDEAEPAQLAGPEIFNCFFKGAGIPFHRQRVGSGSPFKNGYFRGTLTYVMFRCRQYFISVYIYPHIGFIAQGSVQVAVFAFSFCWR